MRNFWIGRGTLAVLGVSGWLAAGAYAQSAAPASDTSGAAAASDSGSAAPPGNDQSATAGESRHRRAADDGEYTTVAYPRLTGIWAQTPLAPSLSEKFNERCPRGCVSPASCGSASRDTREVVSRQIPATSLITVSASCWPGRWITACMQRQDAGRPPAPGPRRPVPLHRPPRRGGAGRRRAGDQRGREEEGADRPVRPRGPRMAPVR